MVVNKRNEVFTEEKQYFAVLTSTYNKLGKEIIFFNVELNTAGYGIKNILSTNTDCFKT
jgi:hypothetical protein